MLVLTAMLSGCAISQNSQHKAQQDNSTNPTVSGYISVGAAKKF